MAKIYRQCVQCGNDFYINDDDQVYFVQKGLELPKRCYACRKKNKQDRESAVSSPVSYEYGQLGGRRKRLSVPQRGTVQDVPRVRNIHVRSNK